MKLHVLGLHITSTDVIDDLVSPDVTHGIRLTDTFAFFGNHHR
jgi:hypothetical protein